MKITELMDNYTDNEFLIEGGQEADAEKVLQGVNAKVKVKKHLKLRTKVIIAFAAVFIGLFAITAATRTTTFVSRLGYIDDWSAISAEYTDTNSHRTDNWVEPYKIVNGRVFFTAVDEGEEEIDITDLISEEKAFYYEYSKADSSGKVHDCIIAVGGTPDDLGYGEMFLKMGFDNSATHIIAKNIMYEYYFIDGKEILEKDLTEEQYDNRKMYPYRNEEKPWYKDFRLKGPEKMSVDEMIEQGVSGEEEEPKYFFPQGSY